MNKSAVSVSLNQPKRTYSSVAKPVPKKDQAIVFNAVNDKSLEDYITAISKLVDIKNIIGASHISNNRLCFYFSNKEIVNCLVETHGGFHIDDTFIPVRKLQAPTKKLIFSNVHLCIPDSAILEELGKLNVRPASTIKTLHVRYGESKEVSHIASFRRFMFVFDDEKLNLPDSILLNFEDENYRIFISNDDLRCFLCKSHGHISANCDKNVEDTASATVNVPSPTLEGLDSADLGPAMTTATKRGAASVSTENTGNIETTASSSDIIPPPKDVITVSSIKVPPAASEGISSSSKPPKKKKKTKENASSPMSTLALLKATEKNIVEKFNAKQYPLSFNNFTLLMDNVRGYSDPIPFIHEFTDDIDGIKRMIRENYEFLQYRGIKRRFTALLKRIDGSATEQDCSDMSTDECDDNN